MQSSERYAFGLPSLTTEIPCWALVIQILNNVGISRTYTWFNEELRVRSIEVIWLEPHVRTARLGLYETSMVVRLFISHSKNFNAGLEDRSRSDNLLSLH
jgi:hypothetical protein